MRRTLLLILLLSLLLILFLPCASFAEERIVLTIGDTKDRSGERVDGENQLGLWQYLEDQLDVEIRFIYLKPDEYASAMSSGNLPDIVVTNNNLAEILENGLALNAEPYLEEYVPNFLQGEAGLTYDLFKQLANDGDGFYFFPEQIGTDGVGYSNAPYNRGYVVRWDYYKELGYPPINNEDDYLDVLRQMHANHPFTEEGYPTYLYGFNNHSGYSTAFRAEVSLNYWVAYKYQNNIFTNEVFDGYTDPDHSMWWTSMAWFNKLYQAGIEDGSFDIDVFSQTTEQHEIKCARGQYLGLHNGKESFYNGSVKKDADTLAGYGTVPTAATNYYTNNYQLLGNGSAFMWFISANSPHKEAALKLINYMCDPYFLREAAMGQQGITWDYDADGVPRMTEYGQEQLNTYIAGNASSDNYYVQWGTYSGLTDRWPLLRNNMKHPDGYPLDFVTISRAYAVAGMTNNISRDICEHYGVELPSDAFYQAGGLDYRNDCGEAITSCMSSLNRDQLHILSSAEAILEDVWVDLCLAETDEEWNTIQNETIRKLIELGEPEVFKDYQQKWDAAAAVIVPLARQAQIANGVEPYTPEEYVNHQAGMEGQLK
ncbi:MAG: extracellular solute-binding protein [Oscillospiraceae bacterium]|nr:extracellular solute-binding protein [Oscillospiraceae bacterium]